MPIQVFVSALVDACKHVEGVLKAAGRASDFPFDAHSLLGPANLHALVLPLMRAPSEDAVALT